MNKKQKKTLQRIIIAAILTVALALLFHFVALPWFVQLILWLVPYLVIGHDVLRKAFMGIKNGEVFDENFLMAIATVGAQIHPEVLGKELTDRLSPYLRMTFAVEQPVVGGRNASGHGRRNPRRQVKVLGKSKDLKALQVKFAQEAEESARRMVKKQADKAADQGKIVQQANLLHRSGATTESRASMLWHGALDALRLPDERISSRWLGTEALMLASAPYRSTKELAQDLQ